MAVALPVASQLFGLKDYRFYKTSSFSTLLWAPSYYPVCFPVILHDTQATISVGKQQLRWGPMSPRCPCDRGYSVCPRVGAGWLDMLVTGYESQKYLGQYS